MDIHYYEGGDHPGPHRIDPGTLHGPYKTFQEAKKAVRIVLQDRFCAWQLALRDLRKFKQPKKKEGV